VLALVETTLQGRLVDESGNPLGGWNVTAEPVDGDPTVFRAGMRTAADGTFAFAGAYPVGRNDVYAAVPGQTDLALFDAVLAPDGGPIQLVLDRCP